VKHADYHQLWRNVHSAGTLVAGRTPWISAGYWLIRARVHGDWRPRRQVGHIEQVSSAREMQRAIDRRTADARRCTYSGVIAHYGSESYPSVLCHEPMWRPEPVDRASVRVALDADFFHGITELVAETTEHPWELRVDPWIGVASWWTLGARPYPLALLMHRRFDTLSPIPT
jgi:hypothetical protein